MKTLIANGIVVTEDNISKTDVLIEDGKIKEIGELKSIEGADIIDASGKLVLPGGIDVHTHLDLDVGATVSSDDFYTGHIAAAFGGTTTHIDFATQNKEGTLKEAFDEWMGKADGKAVIDYGFHMAVVEANRRTLKEIEELPDWGITSIKVYMAYKNILQLEDEEIYKVMEVCARKGILVGIHAEIGDLVDYNVKKLLSEGKTEPKYHAISRPAELEADAIDKAVLLANSVGAVPYIVHVSSAIGIERIIDARAKGLKVLSETCPQYLLLDDEKLALPNFEGAKFVCSPPLRKKDDNKFLWDALSNGEFEIVSTDHCPFNFDNQKTLGKDAFNNIPNGLPGIEDRIPLLYSEGVKTGKLTLREFVNLTSTNPAKVFGLYPKKGVIAPGSDADIYLLNPEKGRIISSDSHHMNVDYNPYEGHRVNCEIEYVILRGELIIAEGELNAVKGSGQYLKRNPGILDRARL